LERLAQGEAGAVTIRLGLLRGEAAQSGVGRHIGTGEVGTVWTAGQVRAGRR
jgi:hypothetical protein